MMASNQGLQGRVLQLEGAQAAVQQAAPAGAQAAAAAEDEEGPVAGAAPPAEVAELMPADSCNSLVGMHAVRKAITGTNPNSWHGLVSSGWG